VSPLDRAVSTLEALVEQAEHAGTVTPDARRAREQWARADAFREARLVVVEARQEVALSE
jgi:hypothetical protein